MVQHKSPCSECPFSRKVEPGTLGGSPIQMYIGQIGGPFWLPCHAHTNYEDPNWKTDIDKPQCAGAAIFRSNVGVADRMPVFLTNLPADTEKVFSSFAEFVSHHMEVSIGTATVALISTPPDLLTKIEMQKIEVKKLGT